MRTNHYLKKNASTEIPSNILIVDTEANILRKNGVEYQSFRLGYAIHLIRKKANDWYYTRHELPSIKDFWLLLDKFQYDKKRLYVFAHNMAYDYTILKIDSYLSSRQLEIKMRVLESAFLVRAGNILFVSTTNYYKQSLKELGEIFGLSKMESPDFENCTDSELMPYCKRDVEVLTHIIKQYIAFIVEKNLGCFRPTIAGQAMTAFRHRFMNHNLLVHCYPDILNLERESYRGGRCEAFRLGKFKNIYCLDINSMYPFVMRENLYPTSLLASSPISNLSINELTGKEYLIANCNIVLRKPFLACKREKLFFPIGKVRQTITSPEINYILEHPEIGEIVKVNTLVPYSQEKIFKDYVDFFYYEVRKKAKNKAEDSLAKLFLNSIYGKFGQHNSTIPELVTDKNTVNMYRKIMKQLSTFEIFVGIDGKYVLVGDFIYHIKKSDGDFTRDAIPSIASAVTSYARRELYRLMDKAGLENVFYCDTDSLFVNEIGFNNLSSEISPNELGKLKLEKSGDVEIFGAKDYRFNDEVKLKGVKKDAKKLSENSYSQSQFITKNRRYHDAIPDGFVRIDTITKTISRNYDKGIVKDGYVFPLIYSEF